MNKQEIENFLYQQIPLAASMGLKVVEVGRDQVELMAPLAPNRNHLGGAFGGSLQTLLIFSGYTWLFHFLHETGDCHVLIQEAKTSYLLPVKEDMKVICLAPDRDALEKFMKMYERKGRARISLQATVHIHEGIACQFVGDFVAEKSNRSGLD